LRVITSMLAVAVVTFLWGMSRSQADVLILESNVEGFKRGQQLSDEQRLSVPAGGHIKLLRPAGDVEDISGPFNRLVSDLTRGEPINTNIWDTIKRQLSIGGDSKGGSVGATRRLKQ